MISALLSRCQVYVLKHLEIAELKYLLDHALKNDEYLKEKDIAIKEYEAFYQYSGGDARKLYNILELVSNLVGKGEQLEVTNEIVKDMLQRNIAIYDKAGEQHYDMASAYIKSIRGSDPNAAVYYLARMIEGGEDIKFIARRLMISASEDIGLANPNALLMATTCFQAIQAIGLPEARILLSQATIYLATSPKSNSAYRAIKKAQGLVQQTGNLPVPLHIRNAPTKLMKDLDYAKGYKYAHDYEGNFADLEFLPEAIKATKFYDPGKNPPEEKMRGYLKKNWKGKYGY